MFDKHLLTLKHKFVLNSVIPLISICPTEVRIYVYQNIYTGMFALFIITSKWKTPNIHPQNVYRGTLYIARK